MQSPSRSASQCGEGGRGTAKVIEQPTKTKLNISTLVHEAGGMCTSLAFDPPGVRTCGGQRAQHTSRPVEACQACRPKGEVRCPNHNAKRDADMRAAAQMTQPPGAADRLVPVGCRHVVDAGARKPLSGGVANLLAMKCSSSKSPTIRRADINDDDVHDGRTTPCRKPASLWTSTAEPSCASSTSFMNWPRPLGQEVRWADLPDDVFSDTSENESNDTRVVPPRSKI
eukprot:TRINITY_DN11579_c0_g1_i5.p1 TRINITY_DN11579_c0_g1~~TRINITY_DN11579_c0_g1_i5.p1  ORF type:complete len:227 (+),score=24.07 TRINITY_DN11579_c0_g1_i5:93-773(+)